MVDDNSEEQHTLEVRQRDADVQRVVPGDRVAPGVHDLREMNRVVVIGRVLAGGEQ